MNLILNQQLHGYRQGHQMLSTCMKLDKTDQASVDRLSDVAGPLRPSERFQPYLSLYPLPSMTHYVVARTWQDMDATRAGCVNTRSIFVPMAKWERGVSLQACVALLDTVGPKVTAEPLELPVTNFAIEAVQEGSAFELVEAIFLEDRQPIAVFGSTAAEAIAVRLITAVWPRLRCELAISTFALSPRSLGGRSFDIVFSPKDARSRFGDWSGRKIDAAQISPPRHRWSASIAKLLFQSAQPSLISNSDAELVTGLGISQESDLRIAYLWTELLKKLHQSPHAILGLLDIANSRPRRSVESIHALEPQIAKSADLAVDALAPADAWRFLLALTDKLHGVPVGFSVLRRIRSAAYRLAISSPEVALRSIDMLVESRDHPLLIGPLGDGISLRRDSRIAEEFSGASPAGLIQALVRSRSLAGWLIPEQPHLSEHIAAGLSLASPRLQRIAKSRLLPLLVESVHFGPAALLIRSLDGTELCCELVRLYKAGSLNDLRYRQALKLRSKEISAKKLLMDAAAHLSAADGAYLFISEMLASNAQDIRWVIGNKNLVPETRARLAAHLVDLASDSELRAMLAFDKDLFKVIGILCEFPHRNADEVVRTLSIFRPEGELTNFSLLRVLPFVSGNEAQSLAEASLERLFIAPTNKSWAHSIESITEYLGARVHASRIVRAAMHPDVSLEIFERNVAAIESCIPPFRRRIVKEINLIAQAISMRGFAGYSLSTARALGRLIWDSAAVDSPAQLKAAASLLPILLATRHINAGPMVAATFPTAYQVLRRSEDTFGLFKFFTSHDWDKCRDAREDLVSSYLESEWDALDFATTAARSEDMKRILKVLAQRSEGAEASQRIRAASTQLPQGWRWEIEEALSDLDFRGKDKKK